MNPFSDSSLGYEPRAKDNPLPPNTYDDNAKPFPLHRQTYPSNLIAPFGHI